MRGARASHDDGEEVYLGTLPPSSDVCEWGVFISDKLRRVRDIIVCTILSSPI
jgi:hypothetical protein